MAANHRYAEESTQHGMYLTVITNGTASDAHAEQAPAVALGDLYFEVAPPAVIAVCVTTLHGGGLSHRHITEATPTFKLSILGHCIPPGTRVPS